MTTVKFGAVPNQRLTSPTCATWPGRRLPADTLAPQNGLTWSWWLAGWGWITTLWTKRGIPRAVGHPLPCQR